MTRFANRTVFAALAAGLALALLGAGCGESFNPDKCLDRTDLCDQAGATRCNSANNGQEVCATDADGCQAWMADIPCGERRTCNPELGLCLCNNTCDTPNLQECAGSVIRTCNADASGCLAWVNGQDCATDGLACDDSSGLPVCAATCTSNCSALQVGNRRCVANTVQACGEIPGGCLRWQDLANCTASGQSCVSLGGGQAECADQCQDQCDPADYPQCAANGFLETCVVQADGCTDLIGAGCQAGFVCDPDAEPPACVLDCTGQCTLDETRCAGDFRAVETCQAQTDACNAFVQTEACQVGSICEVVGGTAQCVACTPDCDGKECGPDGCGGECAPGCDPETETCTPEGLCENTCVPDCAGKDCGPDGCGGECGTCEDGEACNATQHCQAVVCVDPILDGSFEGGSPSADWAEFSTQYGSPLCAVGLCGNTNYAADGDWWVWFGGAQGLEEGSMTQDVVIPAATFATLSFGLGIGGSATGANPDDFVEVTLDGVQVFRALRSEQESYPLWTLVTVDVSAYADGQSHTLQFFSRCDNQGTASSSFLVDVVWIDACDFSGCTNDCDPAGFPVCAGDAIQTCEVNVEDGCYDVITTGCPAGETCQDVGGVPTCVAGCSDECLVGDYPACSGDAIDTCELQADGCYDLVSTACPAGETCQDVGGVPTCVAGCSDECLVGDYPACNADAIDTCVLGADGCYDLASTACPAGQTCELVAGVPTCVAGCSDECDPTAANYPICSLDHLAIENCVLGGDGCYDLVSTGCQAGEMCVDAGGGPVCQPTCMDQCNTVGDTRCQGDVVQECQVQVTGCRDWSDVEDCAAGGGTCQTSGGGASCVFTVLGDTCANPFVVTTFPFQVAGNDITTDFTDALDLRSRPGCGSAGNGQDIIFQVDLTAGDILQVVEAGSMDSVIRIIDACDAATANCLAYVDDPEGPANPLTYTATADGTVYVVVEKYSTSSFNPGYDITIEVVQVICTPGTTACNASGNLETCNALGTAVVETVCPIGCGDIGGGVLGCLTPDTCETAQVLDLSSGSASTPVNNTSATNTYADYAGCNSTRTGFDVWHTFTLTDEADVVIATSGPGTVTDTIMALLDGCGGTQLACNDDAVGLYSRITGRLPAGTYYVVSEPYTTTSRGTWTLTVTATYRAPVTQWDFTGDTLVPSLGTGTASHGAGQTSTFVAGPGGAPNRAWNLNTWSTGALNEARFFQFTTDLTGGTACVFRFDSYHSATGPADIEVYYSLDGSTFQALPNSVTSTGAATTWAPFAYDISSVADGQADVSVRIHGYNASGETGTLRVDNATFACF
jgi:hypothetical protein